MEWLSVRIDAKLGSIFFEDASQHQRGADAFCLQAPPDCDETDKQKSHELLHTTTNSTTPSVLAFWGKVVHERQALFMPRATLLPIPVRYSSSAKEYKFNLYLDGSRVQNTRRSDCCLAWMAALEKPKKETISDEKKLQKDAEKKAKSDEKIMVKNILQAASKTAKVKAAPKAKKKVEKASEDKVAKPTHKVSYEERDCKHSIEFAGNTFVFTRLVRIAW